MSQRTVVVIPARYASSRYPGKPLVSLRGRPLVVWSARLAARAVPQTDVYVATDDRRIADVVEGAGFAAVMTPSDLPTGTDRIWAAAGQIEADVFVNVQGDELLFERGDLVAVLDARARFPDLVINAMRPLGADEDPADVNIPKVVTSEAGRLLYMSRLPVPGFKSPAAAPRRYMKQVCIYAFDRAQLGAFAGLSRKSAVEACEDIEILRFLDLGFAVQMVETSDRSCAVDVPADVARAERMIDRWGAAP